MPFTDDNAEEAHEMSLRLCATLLGTPPAVALAALALTSGTLIAAAIRPDGVAYALDQHATATRQFAETALLGMAEGELQ